jgi:hypothetical protein
VTRSARLVARVENPGGACAPGCRSGTGTWLRARAHLARRGGVRRGRCHLRLPDHARLDVDRAR